MKKAMLISIFIFLIFFVWFYLWSSNKTTSNLWSSNKTISKKIENEKNPFEDSLKNIYLDRETIFSIIDSYSNTWTWNIEKKIEIINKLAKFIINKDFFESLYNSSNSDSIKSLESSDRFWRYLIIDKDLYHQYEWISFKWKEKFDNIPVYIITFQILKWRYEWLDNENILKNLKETFPKFMEYFTVSNKWEIFLTRPWNNIELNYSGTIEQYMDFIIFTTLRSLWKEKLSNNLYFGTWLIIKHD